MTDRRVFKNNLKKVDRQTRMCLLYLENTMNEQFKTALQVKKPQIPKVDFSKFESQFDSLQKQINGLRIKIDAANSLVKNFGEHEILLKSLTNKAEMIIEELTEHFNELYKSGYYKEGTKRKIRAEGLIKQ